MLLRRMLLVIFFCILLFLAPARETQAQEDCDLATVNADMLALVSNYLALQSTAQDGEAALNLVENFQSELQLLLQNCGRALPSGGDVVDTTNDPMPTPVPPVEEDTRSPFFANNTVGQPIEPQPNFEETCSEIRASNDGPRTSTTNAFRITTFLPGGTYTAILLPARFQNFDPMLVVYAGTPESGDVSGFCVPESANAREYVVDFSRGGIGSQVFGHISGGVLEFVVPGGSTEVTPVEILVGGQDGSSAGISGEFVLIIEGARLTSGISEHVFNVSITNSLIDSDQPFGVIAMGVSDILDPNLQAGVYTSSDTFEVIFECEDAGQIDCSSDASESMEGASVVEAAVRTVRGDDRDAAILVRPSVFLDRGVQEVSYIISQQNGAPSRDEYIIAFYGALQ